MTIEDTRTKTDQAIARCEKVLDVNREIDQRQRRLQWIEIVGFPWCAHTNRWIELQEEQTRLEQEIQDLRDAYLASLVADRLIGEPLDKTLRFTLDARPLDTLIPFFHTSLAEIPPRTRWKRI